MIIVKSYIPSEDKTSSTVATVSLYIEAYKMTLNHVKYVRTKSGNLFLSIPSKMIENGGEKPSYVSYCVFDKDRADRFQSDAQKAITQYLEKNDLQNKR